MAVGAHRALWCGCWALGCRTHGLGGGGAAAVGVLRRYWALLDGSWGMVGHGGCGIQGVAPMRWEGATVGRRAHSMQGERGGHARWR